MARRSGIPESGGQKRERQSEWPVVKREPQVCFLTPTAFQISDRSLVGPLRLGTAPGVGPRGREGAGGNSDLGMDRVSPRGFDPMGTSLEREPRQESSRLISDVVRRGYRR
jgi:hypothetical protein